VETAEAGSQGGGSFGRRDVGSNHVIHHREGSPLSQAHADASGQDGWNGQSQCCNLHQPPPPQSGWDTHSSIAIATSHEFKKGFDVQMLVQPFTAQNQDACLYKSWLLMGLERRNAIWGLTWLDNARGTSIEAREKNRML